MKLSPSLAHAPLLRSAPLALRYEGQPFATWQRQVRAKVRSLIALPENDHARVAAKRLWVRDTPLGRIEKLLLRTEPNVEIPAYWCVPTTPLSPQITAICLQGHSTGMHNSIAVGRDDETQSIDVPGDRDFALGCLRRGIHALCLEQRSMGERREKDQKAVCGHNTCHDAAWRAALLGRTLQGERVFDVDRALDYLAQRGDIDMRCVGVMGNSGGGTTTTYAGATLNRVAFCMPSCAIASFAGSIGSIYHCGCNYIPGILNHLDMGDLLGAAAPRPLVVVSGKTDDIFPLKSARAEFRQAQAIYTAAGAPDHCRHVVGPEGHRFYADLAWSAMLPMLQRQ